VTYERHDHVSGPFLHGTKAELQPGDELVAGRSSNFQEGRVMKHIYFTTLESTAAWGAQLAAALAGLDSRGHVYAVEPLGPFEDDPNVTDKRFPGNPTESYRTQHALRVLHEVEDWSPHPPEALQAMLESLAKLREQGLDVIED
jgi:rifampin ADP-ribosylating transferase